MTQATNIKNGMVNDIANALIKDNNSSIVNLLLYHLMKMLKCKK
jgi:hypothetical protein